MGQKVWAVRAEEFLRYDGTNADEVLDFMRQGMSDRWTWTMEEVGETLFLRYFGPMEDGVAPGEYQIQQGSWVGPSGGTVEDRVLQSCYVQVDGPNE
jgi:hypothetical protein